MALPPLHPLCRSEKPRPGHGAVRRHGGEETSERRPRPRPGSPRSLSHRLPRDVGQHHVLEARPRGRDRAGQLPRALPNPQSRPRWVSRRGLLRPHSVQPQTSVGQAPRTQGALQAGGPCSGAHELERHETTELVHTGPWRLPSDVAPKSTWGYVIVGETGLGSQMWPRTLPQLGTLGKAFASLCPVPTWRGGWRTERSTWASFSAELGAW